MMRHIVEYTMRIVIRVKRVIFLALGALPLGAQPQSIHIESRFATMDRPLVIHASGLSPWQSATIRASSVDKSGKLWVSSLTETADRQGRIDVPAQGPEGVATTSALLTLMTPKDEETRSSRFEVSWSDTVITVISLEIGRRLISTDTLLRTFGTPDIAARPINDSGLIGTLFESTHRGRRPGILVLGGSEGGNSAADLAFQLAGHGYTTLSLAYFGANELPPQLQSIPLEYFARALDFLRARGSVKSGQIGIVATSKGSEAALVLASQYPGIRAVVAYAPSSVVWSCICDAVSHSSWSLGGDDVPSVPPGADPNYRHAPPIRPAVNYAYRMRTAEPDAAIEASKIMAPVYLIAGGDDGLWPSAPMASALYKKLSPPIRAGSQLTIYPHAGHLIGKSLLPAGSTLIARGRIDTGGTPAANAEAGRDAWPRVLRFLHKTLGD
jgi:dienelactone hydrolase